ncbi:hypothetical protein ACJX0J_036466, partial [Zea mays]
LEADMEAAGHCFSPSGVFPQVEAVSFFLGSSFFFFSYQLLLAVVLVRSIARFKLVKTIAHLICLNLCTTDIIQLGTETLFLVNLMEIENFGQLMLAKYEPFFFLFLCLRIGIWEIHLVTLEAKDLNIKNHFGLCLFGVARNLTLDVVNGRLKEHLFRIGFSTQHHLLVLSALIIIYDCKPIDTPIDPKIRYMNSPNKTHLDT